MQLLPWEKSDKALEISYIKLDENEARKLFLNLQTIFRRMINNNNVFNYNNPLYLDKVTFNNGEIEDEDIEVYDYYFKIDNKYYTLDISHNPDDFGYVSEYFAWKYGMDYDKLFYCQLFSFNGLINRYGTYDTMSFVYDKDKNKILEVLELEKIGAIIDYSRLIKEAGEDGLSKVLR